MEISEDFVMAFAEKCAAMGLDEVQACLLLRQTLDRSMEQDDDFSAGYAEGLEKAANFFSDSTYAAGVDPSSALWGGGAGGTAGLLLGGKFRIPAAIAGALVGGGASNYISKGWDQITGEMRMPVMPSWMASGQGSGLDEIATMQKQIADQIASNNKALNSGNSVAAFQARQQNRMLRQNANRLATEHNRMRNVLAREHGSFARRSAGADSRLGRIQARESGNMARYSNYLDRADDGSASGWLRGRWADFTGADNRAMQSAARYETAKQTRGQLDKWRDSSPFKPDKKKKQSTGINFGPARWTSLT